MKNLFTEAMKNNLISKTHGQKEMLVEGALNELTYEELKIYLFEPYSTLDNILENELAKDNLQDMSKEQLIRYINMGRIQSIWDSFSNIENRIYTEDDLKQILSAISRTLVNGLGSIVETWQESVCPFLSALRQITLEAIQSKYDLNKLIPSVVSNEALTAAGMIAKGWADIVMPSASMQVVTNDFAGWASALHSSVSKVAGASAIGSEFDISRKHNDCT